MINFELCSHHANIEYVANSFKIMWHMVTEGEVSFLRGHVAQITQSISQLSLPPQEEARKRMVAVLGAIK